MNCTSQIYSTRGKIIWLYVAQLVYVEQAENTVGQQEDVCVIWWKDDC